MHNQTIIQIGQLYIYTPSTDKPDQGGKFIVEAVGFFDDRLDLVKVKVRQIIKATLTANVWRYLEEQGTVVTVKAKHLRPVFPNIPNRTEKQSSSQPLSHNLWMRLGISLDISAREAHLLINGDADIATETLRNIIREGRFVPDGDSYIPEPVVSVYNKKFGTQYIERDINFVL